MTRDWRSEYDGRQYQLMADYLQRYEQGKTDLPSLIIGLDALLEALELPDKAWKDDFRSEWGSLEVLHAIALDHAEQGLAPDVETTVNQPNNQALIKQAINNMRRLLTDRITTESVASDS